MSLDFYYDKVVEFPGMWIPHHEMYGVPYDGEGDEPQYMGPELNAVIWSTLDTGIAYIAEDNWEEAFKRYSLMRGLIRSEPFLTALDFKHCVGLRTNATHYKSRKQWLREYVDRCMENMSRWVDVEHVCTVCGNTRDGWKHKKSAGESYHEFDLQMQTDDTPQDSEPLTEPRP